MWWSGGFCPSEGFLNSHLFVRLSGSEGHRGNRHAPKNTGQSRMVWELFYMEILKTRLHEKFSDQENPPPHTSTGQIRNPVSRAVYLLHGVIFKLIFKFIQFVRSCLELCEVILPVSRKCPFSVAGNWEQWCGEGLTLPSASMSLWGPGKNHCSIKGHKKRINLNLVYNAMPFKLIHLACAPDLPASPSIPHSFCQSSLSTGGVNVNSTAA